MTDLHNRFSLSSNECPGCASTTAEPHARIDDFDVFRCGACHLAFVPAQQVRAVDYDALYAPAGGYSKHVEQAAALSAGDEVRLPKARRVALRQIRRQRPSTLLEVGCGVGYFLRSVERLGRIRTYGIDLSNRAIAMAGKYLSSQLHCGTLEKQTFGGMKFDAICLWEVLEHVASPLAFMSSIFDRLNAGGYVYLSTPNCQSSWVWRDIGADPRSRPPVHLTFWDRSALQAHMKYVGFSEVNVKTFSVPVNAARRSGGPWIGDLVYLDSLLRPSQRLTLLGIGRR